MLYRTSPFTRFARQTAVILGHPLAFIIAVLTIVVWAIIGPFFHFSDTWQLVINTGTTIITFLMVFLIQNTQNRDTESIQLKLDELIRAVEGANNGMLDIEELTDQDLKVLKIRYEDLAKAAREELRARGKDSGTLNMPR